MTEGGLKKIGVLLPADVVDYTPQANELGADICGQFDNSFEAAVK